MLFDTNDTVKITNAYSIKRPRFWPLKRPPKYFFSLLAQQAQKNIFRLRGWIIIPAILRTHRDQQPGECLSRIPVLECRVKQTPETCKALSPAAKSDSRLGKESQCQPPPLHGCTGECNCTHVHRQENTLSML